jgi:hypothetical protein
MIQIVVDTEMGMRNQVPHIFSYFAAQTPVGPPPMIHTLFTFRRPVEAIIGDNEALLREMMQRLIILRYLIKILVGDSPYETDGGANIHM